MVAVCDQVDDHAALTDFVTCAAIIDFLLSFDYTSQMPLSVSEFAEARGVSRQRAQELK